tara:strand:+ start:734 stop:961 length:228 start_codon:yes stop_codon:yes gene_type:complete
MSEPQSQEIWDKKEPLAKKEPNLLLQSINLEIQAKLEKWYHSTFINRGLDIQTFNHIYKSVEGLKESIAESLKEK